MPTKKPRVTFAISDEDLARITDFQFSNRIKNQSQAILKLLELGIKGANGENVTIVQGPRITDEEMEVIEKYRLLDKEDRIRVDERIDTLLSADKYKKKAQTG